jgi:hypothetical protein
VFGSGLSPSRVSKLYSSLMHCTRSSKNSQLAAQSLLDFSDLRAYGMAEQWLQRRATSGGAGTVQTVQGGGGTASSGGGLMKVVVTEPMIDVRV